MDKELLNSLDGARPDAELAADLLDLAMGDTGDFLESGVLPGTVADEANADTGAADAGTNDENQGEQEPDAQAAGDAGADAGAGEEQDGDPQAAQAPADADTELDPANTVILAKDRKHTIPYEKLIDARNEAKQERALREELQRKLDELQQAAQVRHDAGQEATQADLNAAAAQQAIAEGVDPDIFGDFSEEALAKGVKVLAVQAAMEAARQEAKAIIKQELAPFQQKQIEDQIAAHYTAIYQAHPDADSIAESVEFANWKASRPSYEQAGIAHVLTNGSPQEVIELFSQFKQATGVAQGASAAQQPSAEQARAAAQQAINKAKAEPPATLSDIPGGKPAQIDRFEAIAAKDTPAMADALMSMTPEQVEAFLNRNL